MTSSKDYTPSDPMFPHIKVQLTGNSGNVFAIIAEVRQALRRGMASQDQVDEYVKEATAGDYDNLLGVTMRWVTVT